MFQSSFFSAQGKYERDKRRNKQRQRVEMGKWKNKQDETSRIHSMKEEWGWG